MLMMEQHFRQLASIDHLIATGATVKLRGLR